MVPPRNLGPCALPNEQSALKGLYLVMRSLDPTGAGQTRWAMRWNPALNAFAMSPDRAALASTSITRVGVTRSMVTRPLFKRFAAI